MINPQKLSMTAEGTTAERRGVHFAVPVNVRFGSLADTAAAISPAYAFRSIVSGQGFWNNRVTSAAINLAHRRISPRPHVFPVSQRIKSIMTLVERWTSCQTKLRSIPSCAPSSGNMKNATIKIIMP